MGSELNIGWLVYLSNIPFCEKAIWSAGKDCQSPTAFVLEMGMDMPIKDMRAKIGTEEWTVEEVD
jgi:hypothetical protein